MRAGSIRIGPGGRPSLGPLEEPPPGKEAVPIAASEVAACGNT